MATEITKVTDETRYLLFTNSNASTFRLDKSDILTLNYDTNQNKVFIKHVEGELYLNQSLIVAPISDTAKRLYDIINGYLNASGESSEGFASEATAEQSRQELLQMNVYKDNVIERLDKIIFYLEQILS